MKKGSAAMKGHRFWWLALAAFLLDRGCKLWVSRVPAGRWPLEIWPGVLRLNYVQNTGAAFGLLQGQSALLAIVTAGILLGLLIWLLLRGKTLSSLPNAALWLLLGGAIGNLYDRILYGYVVDYIEIRLFRFPIFNIADICVCVAFALLAGWILFGEKKAQHGG